mmetsp:Transcript_1603/g.1977  ORF Transcript_1603/g.1977 Transcript_1603/m.1977 type:complete len:245 (+) Transcript_1603:32-766(+)|eukprot:jgi/Bigna1/50087/estExt_Genewise1.C_660060
MHYTGPSFNLKTILKTAKVSDHTQKHLTKVYSLLMATVVAAFIGAWICMNMVTLSPNFCTIGSVAGLIIIMAMGCTQKRNTRLRVSLMILFGFTEGICLSPLLKMANVVDERIIATAFLGTATIFLCFSMAALTSKRRSFLYLGGILGSTLMLLFFSSLLNIFFNSTFLFSIELYVGLAMFMGYVLFDTQVIIEAAEKGNDDFSWDAMKLFIDLVGIFVRILIILIKLNSKKGKSSSSPLDAIV